MIGVNDLSVHSLDDILKNYESIVSEILLKTPSTKLYLQSILPVNNQVRNSGKNNLDIVFLNKKIEKPFISKIRVLPGWKEDKNLQSKIEDEF